MHRVYQSSWRIACRISCMVHGRGSPDPSVAGEVDVVVVSEAVHLLGGDASEAEHADLHAHTAANVNGRLH